jgi:hypothetical protein
VTDKWLMIWPGILLLATPSEAKVGQKVAPIISCAEYRVIERQSSSEGCRVRIEPLHPRKGAESKFKEYVFPTGQHCPAVGTTMFASWTTEPGSKFELRDSCTR